MNYPNQPGQTRPRRPNFFLLFMMAAMALFLYTQYQKSKQQLEQPATIVIPDISNDHNPGLQQGSIDDWRKPRASAKQQQRTAPVGQSNDWSLDTDVSTTSNGNAAANRGSGTGGVVESGDWSLETGASTPAGQGNAKTTREGDWSIGEVETKK